MPRTQADERAAEVTTATPEQDDAFNELRRALFGPEQDRLSHLHEQFNAAEMAL